ncbi:hypothetical protein [Mycolicibacterium vinylchloridicum]|uniref:hypothetical protein n=1 Tax=Mycolicibacterium vinylchloridicum TaxID=2736928 RepID=UPI0015C6B945|nr:hypothetical protein [Mycolicibacterium vinylchloridicum]
MTDVVNLDEVPEDVHPMPMSPSVVYDEPNRRHGHLLIASGGQDYVFINDGGGVIRFGHFAGPAHELTPDQLRVVGEYCFRMADRLEAAQ